jgi:N-acetylmuramoyl-L-alanine amidase CwlA
MVGTQEGTISWFKNNPSQVSAHYLVSLEGDIVQMVKEDKAAHHAGRVSNPSTKLYKKGLNPNTYTIGIECEDNMRPHDIDRTNQIPALAKLINEICDRHEIPKDRDHIVGHNEFYDKKSCPANINLVELVAKVRALANLLPPQGTTDTMIKDQTKIPQIGNMEVQAIASTLKDQEKEIKSLKTEVKNLNKEVETLKANQLPVFTNTMASFLFEAALLVERKLSTGKDVAKENRV